MSKHIFDHIPTIPFSPDDGHHDGRLRHINITVNINRSINRGQGLF